MNILFSYKVQSYIWAFGALVFIVLGILYVYPMLTLVGVGCGVTSLLASTLEDRLGEMNALQIIYMQTLGDYLSDQISRTSRAGKSQCTIFVGHIPNPPPELPEFKKLAYFTKLIENSGLQYYLEHGPAADSAGRIIISGWMLSAPSEEDHSEEHSHG